MRIILFISALLALFFTSSGECATLEVSGPKNKSGTHKIFLRCDKIGFDDGYCDLIKKNTTGKIKEQVMMRIESSQGLKIYPKENEIFEEGTEVKYNYIFWDPVAPEFVVIAGMDLIAYERNDHRYRVVGVNTNTQQVFVLVDHSEIGELLKNNADYIWAYKDTPYYERAKRQKWAYLFIPRVFLSNGEVGLHVLVNHNMSTGFYDVARVRFSLRAGKLLSREMATAIEAYSD